MAENLILTDHRIGSTSDWKPVFPWFRYCIYHVSPPEFSGFFCAFSQKNCRGFKTFQNQGSEFSPRETLPITSQYLRWIIRMCAGFSMFTRQKNQPTKIRNGWDTFFFSHVFSWFSWVGLDSVDPTPHGCLFFLVGFKSSDDFWKGSWFSVDRVHKKWPKNLGAFELLMFFFFTWMYCTQHGVWLSMKWFL